MASDADLQDAVITRELDAVVKQWGSWTDHNIQLSNNVFTIDKTLVSEKLRRVLQVVADLSAKPLSEIRVLDLACLEGQYAVEFARHGARAVAIEGRQANFEKANLAKRVLNLDNLELVLGDVRDLDRHTSGIFDVVLCLGILYHLDAPDVFSFIEKIAGISGRLAVFDTYISLAPKQSYTYKGQQYWGRNVEEHTTNESEENKRAKLWSSIDNIKSVWLTKPTLINLLCYFGFTSVYECYVPVEPDKYADRITLVAVKGASTTVLTCPATNQTKQAAFPEHRVPEVSPNQRPFADLRRAISHSVPLGIRQIAKRALARSGVIEDRSGKWVR